MYLYCGNSTNVFAMISLTDLEVNTNGCVIPPHQSDFDVQNIKCGDESLSILGT